MINILEKSFNTVCLIRGHYGLDKLVNKLGSNSKSAIFLCSDWTAFMTLQARGLASLAWEDIIPSEEITERETWIADRSHLWYKLNGDDFTVIAGHSLGEMLQWFTWCLDMFPLYRLLFVVEQALLQFKPTELWLDSSFAENEIAMIREVASAQNGTTAVRIFQGTPGEGNSYWKRPPLDYGFAKRTSLHIGNFLGKLTGASHRQPTIVFDPYFTSEPLLSSLLSCSARIYLSSPPPRRRFWPNMIVHGVQVFQYNKKYTCQQEELERIWVSWKNVCNRQDWHSLFDWKNFSPWPALKPILHRIFKHEIPAACSYLHNVEKWLCNIKADAVVVPFDGPPAECCLISAARKLGIPSIVLLHGIPGYVNQEDNFRADHFLVWGEGNSETFRLAGANVSKIRISANPYFDLHVKNRKQKTKTIHNVLVITHPWNSISLAESSNDTAKFATGVMQVLKPFTDFRITFKLHPSESPSYYQKILANWLSPRLHIKREGSILSFLSEADLVIGSRSTVLLEAMLLNIPVICFNPSTTLPLPPFNGTCGLSLHRTVAELEHEISQILYNEKAINKALSCCPRLLDRFAGPRYGRNSKMVTADILTIAQNHLKGSLGKL